MAPNYWCTWATQNYMYGHNLAHLDPKALQGAEGSTIANGEMTEANVFGPEGWAEKFLPQVRGELYFLFDAGWESGGNATFILDTQKFPSYSGTPQEGLTKLNAAIMAKGWRGAALWCRKTPGGDADTSLVERSKKAGIRYWKIDGGDSSFSVDRARNQLDAPLTVEHVYGEWPLNGDWRKNGRFEVQTWTSPRVQILRKTDVYRTYDTNSLLSIPTTLDRASQMLNAVQGHPEVHALLNVEDEVYIAAVLGCTMGIMRFPLYGLRPDGDVDMFSAGPRALKKQMDEVVRAIRWQRVAAPYAAGAGFVRLSSEILTDNWVFRPAETWWSEMIGQDVKQGAPAGFSRNIKLPIVKSSGDKPFVIAARFPNGAVAVGVHQRTRADHAWFMPHADVVLDVGSANGPFGIFGQFGSLTLTFARSLRGVKVLAQDIAGDRAMDITHSVKIGERDLYIPGDLISSVGLADATPGDLSDPGMILKVS